MSEAKDADVDRLTKEQIEQWRTTLCDPDDFHAHAISELNALCDIALQSLSQEAVRDEALEEAARVCDAEAEYRRCRHDKPLPGDTDPTIQAHKQITAHKLGQTIRALKREPNAAAQVITPSRDKWEKGEIVRTTEDELCYIRPCEVVGARTKEYEGYSGESYKELGIKIGALVYYIRDPREGYCVKAWKMKHGLPAQDW